MGHAWAALEGAAAAAEQYERALRIEPRNQEALDHLALARFGQRRYEDALALYRTLLEINPDHALTHSNVGAALLRLGRPREALQSIERALALDPDLEIARIGLAEVRKLLDQPANTASAHKMARIIYHLVTHHVLYHDDVLSRQQHRDHKRRERNLRHQARALGFHLVPQAA